MIYAILVTLFLIVCMLMIGAILIQRARGGGLAGAFGGGGSETALGGLQNKEMVKITTWLAIGFMGLAVLLDFNPPERKTEDLPGIVTETAIPGAGTTQEESSTGGMTAPMDEDLGGGVPLPGGDAPIQVEGTGSE